MGVKTRFVALDLDAWLDVLARLLDRLVRIWDDWSSLIVIPLRMLVVLGPLLFIWLVVTVLSYLHHF